VVLGQGNKSHEATGIHQAFQQHCGCMAADRASAASGDAGDRRIIGFNDSKSGGIPYGFNPNPASARG
jgi:hypothetical protein